MCQPLAQGAELGAANVDAAECAGASQGWDKASSSLCDSISNCPTGLLELRDRAGKTPGRHRDTIGMPEFAAAPSERSTEP